VISYDQTASEFRTPGGHPVVMHYRLGTNDFNTLYASLDEDEYDLPLGLTGTALDIGGYLGSVGIALALDNPGLRVVIAEPVPPNADLIRRNIKQNGLGNRVSLLQGAVGAGGETVEVFYGYRGNPSVEHHAFVGNSTLAYDSPGELAHETATYTAVGLSELVEDYGPIRFLKIDTEGAEWAFLESPAVAQVKTIAGEWHPVRGHVQSDIVDLLGATHRVTFSGPDSGPGGFRAERR
jgi:FkbM family methyltransferase